jgi:murein DD-endopeptidase MepM/ murein hydrolase activator NlpD
MIPLKIRPRNERKSAPTSSKAARPYAQLEIQIHPANIRRRVRYLFFSRRRLVLLAAGVAAWVGFVALGAMLAPAVVEAHLDRHEYRALKAERERHGERLGALVARLERIEERAAGLRLKVDKIFLAYGLASDESIGQGGFPPPPAPPLPQTVHANVIRQGYQLNGRVGGELAAIGTFLAEVRAFEDANRERVRTTPSACPLRGDRFVLTSPFGSRRSPFTKNLDFHAGIDFAAPEGTQIHAPADGVVVFAGRYPLQRSVGWWRYGNLVVLSHGDDFRTLFGHCSEVQVRTGQRVRQGEPIAKVGSTGWSTSPHLHYEVRRRDEDRDFAPVDPRIYILDRRWRDEERLLVRARSAPGQTRYEPLPALFSR